MVNIFVSFRSNFGILTYLLFLFNFLNVCSINDKLIDSKIYQKYIRLYEIHKNRRTISSFFWIEILYFGRSDLFNKISKI